MLPVSLSVEDIGHTVDQVQLRTNVPEQRIQTENNIGTGTQNLNVFPGTKMVYLPGNDFARYEPIVDSSEPGVSVFVEFDFPGPVVPLFFLESRAHPPAPRRLLVVNIRQKPNSAKP